MTMNKYPNAIYFMYLSPIIHAASYIRKYVCLPSHLDDNAPNAFNTLYTLRRNMDRPQVCTAKTIR